MVHLVTRALRVRIMFASNRVEIFSVFFYSFTVDSEGWVCKIFTAKYEQNTQIVAGKHDINEVLLAQLVRIGFASRGFRHPKLSHYEERFLLRGRLICSA